MLRMPVNEAVAGRSAGLIGSGPGSTKSPGHVAHLPAFLREDDVSESIYLESPLIRLLHNTGVCTSPITHELWNVTKYIYLSTVLHSNFLNTCPLLEYLHFLQL